MILQNLKIAYQKDSIFLIYCTKKITSKKFRNYKGKNKQMDTQELNEDTSYNNDLKI